jgi:hypothetical protein
MSHFAQLDDNNVVVNVIVAEQDFIDSGAVGDPSRWLRTSYNTRAGIHYDENGEPSVDQSKAFRKNYAGIGHIYHADVDAFVAPKEYPSWTLDVATGSWEPPVPMPIVEKPGDEGIENYTIWLWNEETGEWDDYPWG